MKYQPPVSNPPDETSQSELAQKTVPAMPCHTLPLTAFVNSVPFVTAFAGVLTGIAADASVPATDAAFTGLVPPPVMLIRMSVRLASPTIAAQVIP